MGLLPLLDEESKFPQASDLSLAGMVHYNSIKLELARALSHNSFTVKFHEHFRSSQYYKMPKDGGPTFSILHYAGLVSHSKYYYTKLARKSFLLKVTYETAGFLEKNRDTLKSNASKLLESSSNKVVRALYHTPLSRTGSLSSAPVTTALSATKSPAPSATPLFNRRAPTVRLSVM